MAINWKELELILSEMDMKNSYIQEITEHSYHSFTLSLFSKERKAYYAYAEIATPHSRFCLTDHMRKKSSSMQRFTQYLKAHVRGKKISDVRQLPFDRAFLLHLESPGEKMKLLFRLYSGPGANVIVLSQDDTILELLFRRPGRGETKGEKLVIEERKEEGPRHFEVRPWETATFNETVEKEEENSQREEKRDEFLALLSEKRNRELRELDERERKTLERSERTKDYEEKKHSADLLSSSLHLVRKGMQYITVHDWEREREVTIPLSEKLGGRENLEHLYEDYKKSRTTYFLALEELEKIERERKDCEEKYNLLFSPSTALEKLKKELSGEDEKNGNPGGGRDGLYIRDGEWLIIVGRSAKENDQILRSATRGSDIWLHTRDFAGGYVIIKAQKNRTVPLNILLDAAYLAIFFSKARKNNKAELYYTSVKYLKRIKGAKTGLIIPTQEKNLSVEMDETRVRKLLGQE